MKLFIKRKMLYGVTVFESTVMLNNIVLFQKTVMSEMYARNLGNAFIRKYSVK